VAFPTVGKKQERPIQTSDCTFASLSPRYVTCHEGAERNKQKCAYFFLANQSQMYDVANMRATTAKSVSV